jgi:rhodanese-related sulfurtransferase
VRLLPNPHCRLSLWRQAVAIFFAAIGLGLAYNASSPLGVRTPASFAGLGGSPTLVAWPQVKPLLATSRIVLIDARNAAAFDAGHIPGAISLPFADLGARIEAFSSRVPKAQPIVVYCGSAECPVSDAEARALAGQYGYRDVAEMPGGYAEWRLAEPGAAPAKGGKP